MYPPSATVLSSIPSCVEGVLLLLVSEISLSFCRPRYESSFEIDCYSEDEIHSLMLIIIKPLQTGYTQLHRLEVPPKPVDSCLVLEKLDDEDDLALLGPAPPS